MSVFEHARWEIFSPHQHPMRHAAKEVNFFHRSLPASIKNAEDALNYVLAVLYPNCKDSVPTKADLPAAGNTLNDYRIVRDDGDGKSAGYRWMLLEGEPSASWKKINDMDWGYDSILSDFLDRTQDQYVAKRGRDDRDADGIPLTGDRAGQAIWGGASADTNLTLFANSGDGMGPPTGFVQVGDNFRPIQNEAQSLGTTGNRWLKLWTKEAQIGTLNLSSSGITDSNGEVRFGMNTVSTLGVMKAAAFRADTTFIEAGKIYDSDGDISFLSTNVNVGGDLTAHKITATNEISELASGSKIGNLTLENGKITDSGGTVDFGTNAIKAGQVNADNVRVDGSTVSSTDTDGDLILSANGAGKVKSQSPLEGTTGKFESLGVDNLALDANTLSTTDTNGDLVLAPNGTGGVKTKALFPSADGSVDLGKTGALWNKLWVSGYIGNTVGNISIGALLSFRDACSNASAGDSLFWDAVSERFLPSAPDLEISHPTIKNLDVGDSGHTQFPMLEGRAGGQILKGGTLASQNLALQSTLHATRGDIIANDNLIPGGAAVDLGKVGSVWRDFYMSGTAKGFRLESFTNASRPAASAANAGRMIWNTDSQDIEVDAGGVWLRKSLDFYFFQDATSWDGASTTHTYTVDGSDTPTRGQVSNSQACKWFFKDNSNNWREIGVEITTPTTSTVVVTSDVALAAGTYTLIGIGG